MSEREGFQPWLIAEITLENGFFVHSNIGSYFEDGDAKKAFCIKQGRKWCDEDMFDDFF